MTLLEQLLQDLPSIHHAQRVYWTGDVVEAERIAGLVRELNVRSVRYVLRLERFEPQPALDDPKRAAFDILTTALADVMPRLTSTLVVEKISVEDGTSSPIE